MVLGFLIGLAFATAGQTSEPTRVQDMTYEAPEAKCPGVKTAIFWGLKTDGIKQEAIYQCV